MCPHGVNTKHRNCDRCDEIAEAEHRVAIKTKHFGGPTKSFRLTGPERDIILAALRLWQEKPIYERSEELLAIATLNGTHEALRHHQIDALCEDLNTTRQ